MRISVYDILDWLASGMTRDEILRDHRELEKEDTEAALRFKLTSRTTNRI